MHVWYMYVPTYLSLPTYKHSRYSFQTRLDKESQEIQSPKGGFTANFQWEACSAESAPSNVTEVEMTINITYNWRRSACYCTSLGIDTSGTTLEESEEEAASNTYDSTTPQSTDTEPFLIIFIILVVVICIAGCVYIFIMWRQRRQNSAGGTYLSIYSLVY